MKEIEIPEGYKARIEGNKVVLEPKESENERIRKRLIDCLKFSLKGAEEQDAAGCSRQKDIEAYKWGIAYLEKQKEQKSSKWSEEDEMMLWEFTAWIPEEELAKHNITRNDILEKLKSLRPQPKQGWSEEDIKKIRSEEYTKGFNDAAFGGKLKEWSVEDEDRIRQIERIAQQAGCTQKLQEEIHNWLKSLRPQPQTVYKTAIESILEMCNSCDLKSHFSAPAMDFWASVKVKCEDALRAYQSLNEPYWRPTQDQIQALYNILQDPKKAGSISDRASIVGLIHDLKKLM